MKYRIEIFIRFNLIETYESNDIHEVLKWYRSEWQITDERGGCYVSVYKDNKELSFEEKNDLGFYD